MRQCLGSLYFNIATRILSSQPTISDTRCDGGSAFLFFFGASSFTQNSSEFRFLFFCFGMVFVVYPILTRWDWLLIVDCGLLFVDYWLLIVECWLLIVGLLIVDCCLLIVDCWLLIVDCWLLIVDCWLLIVDCWSLIVDCWLLMIDCWLLICRLSIVDFWLLICWLLIVDPWSLMRQHPDEEPHHNNKKQKWYTSTTACAITLLVCVCVPTIYSLNTHVFSLFFCFLFFHCSSSIVVQRAPPIFEALPQLKSSTLHSPPQKKKIFFWLKLRMQLDD